LWFLKFRENSLNELFLIPSRFHNAVELGFLQLIQRLAHAAKKGLALLPARWCSIATDLPRKSSKKPTTMPSYMAGIAIPVGQLPMDYARGVAASGSTAFVGAVSLVIVWGFTVGRLRVQHCRVPVVIEGLRPELRGLRIAQISDLHIGNGLEGASLQALVERVNGLDADLVVLTGDIFDFDPSALEPGARLLGGLRARLGVYAVLGNHDLYTGETRVADALAAFAPKVVMLGGRLEALAAGAPIYLAGVDDPGEDWTARGIHVEVLERLGDSLPGDGPCLLLAHRPDVFAQASRLGFSLG